MPGLLFLGPREFQSPGQQRGHPLYSPILDVWGCPYGLLSPELKNPRTGSLGPKHVFNDRKSMFPLTGIELC